METEERQQLGMPQLSAYTHNQDTMEDIRDVQIEKRGNICRNYHHLHIQCSTLTKLVAFMGKRHLNSDSTAYNTLYHLQKGLDGTSIQIILLRRIGRGLRCNRKDYIRKGTPLGKGIGKQKLEKRELSVKLQRHTLTFYEQSILGRARGRVYTEFVLHLFILKVLFF